MFSKFTELVHCVRLVLSTGCGCSKVKATIAALKGLHNGAADSGGVMKKWTILPAILLLGAAAVAQTTSPVPAGTALMVKLETTLATFSNKAGDPFRGSITQPVVVNGQTALPAGTIVEGRVTKVSEPRRFRGKPTIGILAEAVILPSGERYYLDA